MHRKVVHLHVYIWYTNFSESFYKKIMPIIIFPHRWTLSLAPAYFPATLHFYEKIMPIIIFSRWCRHIFIAAILYPRLQWTWRETWHRCRESTISVRLFESFITICYYSWTNIIPKKKSRCFCTFDAYRRWYYRIFLTKIVTLYYVLCFFQRIFAR